MFIGHFAVGFAAKRFAPKASLAALLAAPLLADLLWPPFLLLGWEHVRVAPGDTRFTPFDFYDYPWSHSLLMGAVWATLFALLYWVVQGDRQGAVVVWLGVVSHWVLTGLPIGPICHFTRAGMHDTALVYGLHSRDDDNRNYFVCRRSLALCERNEIPGQRRPVRLLGLRSPIAVALRR
jgi:hypothetical protein